MKNYLFLYIIILSIHSFNSIAQKHKVSLADKENKSIKKLEEVSGNLRTVKSYHVEENIKMKFGGYTTIYNVSDSSLINTNDLGPNNIRTITPKSANIEKQIDSQKETIQKSEKPSSAPSNFKPTDTLKKLGEYASVVMIDTYERVAEKGYKSVDIFRKLGNKFYFNDELEKAAKWYGELFAMTTDLEAEYYYRYSASLIAIGENDKANEMLARFNQLSRNNK
jgi:tetratricopeptide (TPR) repeat protein